MNRTFFLILLGVALLVCKIESLSAQETPDAAAKKEAVDRYRVPSGTSVDLLHYIEELQRYIPETPREALDHRKKAAAAIREAAEKILERETDRESEAYRTAKVIVALGKIRTIAWMTPEERAKFGEETLSIAKASDVGLRERQVAFQAAREFESYREWKTAAALYRSVGEGFAKSEEPQLAARAKMLLGAAKRCESGGEAFHLEGDTLAGEKFSLASLQGKFVLVNFWSTTCGPCVAEIPALEKLREEFGPRGFEIASISLDDDRVALQAFLKQRDLSWIVLHDQARNGEHPAIEEYGIMATPTMLLLDREGKVIELDVRAESLAKILPRVIDGAKKE